MEYQTVHRRRQAQPGSLPAIIAAAQEQGITPEEALCRIAGIVPTDENPAQKHEHVPVNVYLNHAQCLPFLDAENCAQNPPSLPPPEPEEMTPPAVVSSGRVSHAVVPVRARISAAPVVCMETTEDRTDGGPPGEEPSDGPPVLATVTLPEFLVEALRSGPLERDTLLEQAAVAGWGYDEARKELKRLSGEGRLQRGIGPPSGDGLSDLIYQLVPTPGQGAEVAL